MKIVNPILAALLLGLAGCARRSTEEHDLTQAQAVSRGLSVPDGSTNIHFASSSVGLGGRALCFRLHAPLSNMLHHIEWKMDVEPSLAHSPLTTPVQNPDMKPYGLEKLSWFDVENITTGYISHAAGYNSTVWIDAERELYYYYWTD